jgi:hypothetical protein
LANRAFFTTDWTEQTEYLTGQAGPA